MTEFPSDPLVSVQIPRYQKGRLYFRDYPLVLWTIVILFAVAMVLYAVSLDFVWDEGFHLLAAQLITKGRTPYVDFCFPQTLLNAYWNAALLHWSGMSWRSTHLAAALASAGSAALAADFVFRRQTGSWRFGAALLAALGVYTNQTLWKYGTCAQAYGLGTFLAMGAFRAAAPCIAGRGLKWAVLAGLLAGAAAGSTLLTAPILPVILIWMIVYSYAGNRWWKAGAYLASAIVPFAPEIFLLIHAPRQAWFNIFQYQVMFRRVNWPGAYSHDFEVLTAWLGDAGIFVMSILSIVAVVLARRWSGTSLNRRAEIYLCAAMGAALTLYISVTHPTFERYFVFAIPFLSTLSAIGLTSMCERIGISQPRSPVVLLALFLMLNLVRNLFLDRDGVTWNNYVRLADKIKQITPANQAFYADEQVYFLLSRMPPPGMEFSYSRKLDLPADQEKLYHIRSQHGWTKEVQAGHYPTVETCKDEVIDEMRLSELFPNEQDFGDCTVYWGPIRKLKPKTESK